MRKRRLYIGGIIATLGVLGMLAMKPAKKGRVSFEAFQSYDFAHRGLHNLDKGIAENTLPAFEKAVEKGFGIEMDIHLTGDGELVVFHDNDLNRACSSSLKVHDSTLEELQSYTLFGTEERMPLFHEALSLVDGRVPIIVELKSDTNPLNKQYTKLCQRAAEMLKEYDGSYCIESFDPRVIRWFKKKYPEVIRGQLMENFRRHGSDVVPAYDFLAKNLLFNFWTKPDFISYQYMDRDRMAFQILKYLYKTQEFSWTVRDPELAAFLKNEGSLVIFEGYEND